MTHRKKEFLVGCLVLLVGFLLALFAWLMGAFNPFARGIELGVHYDFAGGIEVGSAVRVAGVKVGKVDSIEFLKAPMRSLEAPPAGAPPQGALRVWITVNEKAAPSVREDSRFYVNLAGIIGERYIEITPGSEGFKSLQSGTQVRGEDPPRIDQLLSQGYNVFGKVLDFLDSNEESLETFLKELKGFLHEANRLLSRKDWRKLSKLLGELSEMSGEIRVVTKKLKDPQAQEFFNKLSDLIDRAHQVDEKALKNFFQEEGIRARIF